MPIRYYQHVGCWHQLLLVENALSKRNFLALLDQGSSELISQESEDSFYVSSLSCSQFLHPLLDLHHHRNQFPIQQIQSQLVPNSNFELALLA